MCGVMDLANTYVNPAFGYGGLCAWRVEMLVGIVAAANTKVSGKGYGGCFSPNFVSTAPLEQELIRVKENIKPGK